MNWIATNALAGFFLGLLRLLALFSLFGAVEPGRSAPLPGPGIRSKETIDRATVKHWLDRWQQDILAHNPLRHCSMEAGEKIGWQIYPFLEGFYEGYRATASPVRVDRFIACADAWLARAVREPDGFVGWPKTGAAGTDVDNLDDFYADSMLGEAMALTPVVRMAGEIRKNPVLKQKYGRRADADVALSEQIFRKWDARGGWRTTNAGGMITVVLPFGIERKTADWTAGYASRSSPQIGLSHPDNKANFIARWLLAMFDVTGKAIYRDRAAQWFITMKSRMHLKSDGTYKIWNYWQPAGAWDYDPHGAPRHWIGVHPNAGYYDTDVSGIVRLGASYRARQGRHRTTDQNGNRRSALLVRARSL